MGEVPNSRAGRLRTGGGGDERPHRQRADSAQRGLERGEPFGVQDRRVAERAPPSSSTTPMLLSQPNAPAPAGRRALPSISAGSPATAAVGRSR